MADPILIRPHQYPHQYKSQSSCRLTKNQCKKILVSIGPGLIGLFFWANFISPIILTKLRGKGFLTYLALQNGRRLINTRTRSKSRSVISRKIF